MNYIENKLIKYFPKRKHVVPFSRRMSPRTHGTPGNSPNSKAQSDFFPNASNMKLDDLLSSHLKTEILE